MWGQPRTAGRSLRPICQVSGVPPLPPPGTHLHSLPPPSSTISLPPRPATLAKNSPGPRPLPSLLLSGPWKWNGWEEKSTQPRPQNRQSPRLHGLGPQCKKPGGGVPVPAPPVAPSVRPCPSPGLSFHSKWGVGGAQFPVLTSQGSMKVQTSASMGNREP